MTLSCDKPFNNNNYGKGIFINLVKIASAEDISGQQLPFLEQRIDIGIKLLLDIGRDFQPELIIAGNFDRNTITNDVQGWGSGFLIQDALYRLGYSGNLTADNRVPQAALDALKGHQFYRLSYVSGTKDNGKPRYSDWNNIASVGDGPDSLAKRFQKSLLKGYPKNYRPELLDEPVAVSATVTNDVVTCPQIMCQ